jgi:hypothetical protein
VDSVIFALSIALIVLLTSSVALVWRWAALVHRPGIGRILFWALASIKLWADIAVLYFAINSRVPALFGDVHDIRRTGVRLLLALYLVVQSAAVNVALVRWWREE